MTDQPVTTARAQAHATLPLATDGDHKTIPGKAETNGPLQLLPEIFGFFKGKNDSGAAVHAQKPDQAVPIPTPRPKEAAKPPDAKVMADKTLHAIAGADCKDFAPPSLQAQGVVKQFLAQTAHMADKDKPAVLKQLGPAFEKAITSADTAYVKVEKEAEPGIKKAKEGYIVANSSYNQSYEDTLALAKAAHGPDRMKAALLLEQVSDNGAKMPSKEELIKAFKDQPVLLDSMLHLADEQNSVFAASKTLDTANKPVLDAALDQDRTRLAYERAAQSVGEKGLAKSIDSERTLVAEQTKELTDTPEELRKVISI